MRSKTCRIPPVFSHITKKNLFLWEGRRYNARRLWRHAAIPAEPKSRKPPVIYPQMQYFSMADTEFSYGKNNARDASDQKMMQAVIKLGLTSLNLIDIHGIISAERFALQTTRAVALSVLRTAAVLLKGESKLKIAVVDDDIQIYRDLRSYLEELLGDFAEITYYASGESFLEAWKSKSFDLIILDIFMDALTGMEVAQMIRKTDPHVKIAFSTTSNEFASESYEVNACYYLHKPFGKERVKAMMDRLDLAEMEKKRIVVLPDGTNVPLRRIIYVDYAFHFITVHLKQQNDIVLRANFSEIENLLCAYPYFICPTKGVIINFYEVAKQKHDIFIMSDETHIPISRRKATEVLKAYSSFLFAELRKGEDA